MLLILHFRLLKICAKYKVTLCGSTCKYASTNVHHIRLLSDRTRSEKHAALFWKFQSGTTWRPISSVRETDHPAIFVRLSCSWQEPDPVGVTCHESCQLSLYWAWERNQTIFSTEILEIFVKLHTTLTCRSRCGRYVFKPASFYVFVDLCWLCAGKKLLVFSYRSWKRWEWSVCFVRFIVKLFTEFAENVTL